MSETHAGGCLCGATRYVAEGAPLNVRVCHCHMCQKAIGAPFNARALYPADRVTLEGPVGRYRSSADLERGYCTRCGATLFSFRESLGAYGLTLGTFDDPSAMPPTEHIWTESKQAWVALDDGLPTFAGAFPG